MLSRRDTLLFLEREKICLWNGFMLDVFNDLCRRPDHNGCDHYFWKKGDTDEFDNVGKAFYTIKPDAVTYDSKEKDANNGWAKATEYVMAMI